MLATGEQCQRSINASNYKLSLQSEHARKTQKHGKIIEKKFRKEP